MRSRRRLFYSTLLLANAVGSAIALAQEVEFNLLRYEDDLSLARLAADAGQGSWKAIPLAADSWLSLGGELRARLEHLSRPDFGETRSDADGYGLLRALAHADLQVHESARLFVQLGAFAAPAMDDAPPPARDALDVQQAFGELKGMGSFVMRLGRQEIALGSQRFIGLRDGPNARVNFDGVRLLYRGDEVKGDLFALRPVKRNAGAFDNASQADAALMGVYVTMPAPTRVGSLDLYLMHYSRPDAEFASIRGDEWRWQSGLRHFGRSGRWSWDSELTVQGGKVGGQELFAWGIATNTGYTHNTHGGELRIGLKLDLASGDRSRNDDELNTGNAFYPRLPYLGASAAFAPANLIDVHPELGFRRGPFEWNLGYQLLWRHSTDDAVYIAPLVPLEVTTGRGKRFTGQQWSIDFDWSFSPALELEIAAAWVDLDAALEALGLEDSALLSVGLTWRF